MIYFSATLTWLQEFRLSFRFYVILRAFILLNCFGSLCFNLVESALNRPPSNALDMVQC